MTRSRNFIWSLRTIFRSITADIRTTYVKTGSKCWIQPRSRRKTKVKKCVCVRFCVSSWFHKPKSRNKISTIQRRSTERFASIDVFLFNQLLRQINNKKLPTQRKYTPTERLAHTRTHMLMRTNTALILRNGHQHSKIAIKCNAFHTAHLRYERSRRRVWIKTSVPENVQNARKYAGRKTKYLP